MRTKTIALPKSLLTLVLLNKLRSHTYFCQSDYLIKVVDEDSHTEWQIVQILISWLLQKPTDLDLHCLQRQGISWFSRTRVKMVAKLIFKKAVMLGIYCVEV